MSHDQRTTPPSAHVKQPGRVAVIAKAAERWATDLIDHTRNNRLLYYKELKVGTLSLAGAAPSAMTQLLDGERVRLSKLFPTAASIEDARHRIRRIDAKIREDRDERGIETGYLAVGFVTWHDDQATPAAPVLLRGVSIGRIGAGRDDYNLQLADTVEVTAAWATGPNVGPGRLDVDVTIMRNRAVLLQRHYSWAWGQLYHAVR